MKDLAHITYSPPTAARKLCAHLNMSPSFRITLLLSVSLHMVGLGVFQPTFGKPLKRRDFVQISFLGPILETRDFSSAFNYQSVRNKNISNNRLPILKLSPSIKKEGGNFLTLRFEPVKPLVIAVSDKQKTFFMSESKLDILTKRKKEPTVVFYPSLPYSFLLYFRDRQIAHIECMFYISRNGKTRSIKRKISSGNLDADLLALRYIAHCLNIVEARFPPEAWQTVEIDLTRKND